MKNTGVTRKVDDLGRIVLPIELRRSLKVKTGDLLEIHVSPEGDIVLRANKQACGCCGGTAGLVQVRGVSLCRRCVQAFVQKMG